ncbi:MAG: corrinoid protein-associated methyltransferase CpaM [Syntrophobacteraceae bacterium]
MSTYVLMRILESAPRRYEFGIRILTLGHVDKVYDRLAARIKPGQQVLDLGCGTGALTVRAARQGAMVRGIDINARMLEIARQRVKMAGLTERVELLEMGVSQLDGEEANHYDAVMSGLCLSELSEDELTYTLKEATRVLRGGGVLLIADEIEPGGIVKRLIHTVLRVPLAVLAYAVAQQTTRPVSNLLEKLADAGLSIVSVRLDLLGSFGEIAAQKPAGKPS